MSASGNQRAAVGTTVLVQIVWAVLAAAWNFAGAALNAQGQPALGPTASAAAGVVLLAIAVLFLVGSRRWPRTYVAASVFTGLVAGSAVYNALTQDPALWPSELWRYGGAVLNGVGCLAAIRAVVSFVVSRSGR